MVLRLEAAGFRADDELEVKLPRSSGAFTLLSDGRMSSEVVAPSRFAAQVGESTWHGGAAAVRIPSGSRRSDARRFAVTARRGDAADGLSSGGPSARCGPLAEIRLADAPGPVQRDPRGDVQRLDCRTDLLEPVRSDVPDILGSTISVAGAEAVLRVRFARLRAGTQVRVDVPTTAVEARLAPSGSLTRIAFADGSDRALRPGSGWTPGELVIRLPARGVRPADGIGVEADTGRLHDQMEPPNTISVGLPYSC